MHLDTEVIQKDIFEMKDLSSGTIIARAFKPMPIVLDLVSKNFKTYQKPNLIYGSKWKTNFKRFI